MDLERLQERAVSISDLYDRYNVAEGRRAWTTGDLALGFVGDVGDLAKLLLAVEGRREIQNAHSLLGHELADCLWAVLVLADKYGVDLEAEFTRMTGELGTKLGAHSSSSPS
jgi:NTP pyrophosphatase (non-canonical NTP hydrolase)